MSVTIPSSFTGIDPAKLRAGARVLKDAGKSFVQDANFVYANLRTMAVCEDFVAYENGDAAGIGIVQGADSAIDTTADGATWVTRLEGYYYSGDAPTNNDMLAVYADCEATVDDCDLRVQVKTLAGTTIDTISMTITGGNPRAIAYAAAAGTSLDGSVEYHLVVQMRANTGATLYVRRLWIGEEALTSL